MDNSEEEIISFGFKPVGRVLISRGDMECTVNVEKLGCPRVHRSSRFADTSSLDDLHSEGPVNRIRMYSLEALPWVS